MPFMFTMPKLSPTMEEGVIAKWHKKEGEFVESGELLLEITTDKATVEHNALDEGWLRKILVAEGETAHLNDPLAIFTEKQDESIESYQPEGLTQAKPEEKKEQKKKEEGAPVTKETKTMEQPAFVPEPPLTKEGFPEERGERLKATPLAKRLAKEKGLDLASAKGSGPNGRITSRDLESAQSASFVSFGSSERPDVPAGSYEEIPLTPMRKAIGKRLQESKTFIPHFYVKQTIDAGPLVALREQLKNLDLKITYNDMVVRACALALRKMPEMNRGFNSVNQTIIQFKTVDIAVAVTIADGLITPIIRHADYKNLGEIAVEMRDLAEKARKGKLKEEEYRGGSFCVSNLGMYGITEFVAVINPPQAAILAVGGIEERPIVKEGQVVAGHTLNLILSADHRVIDGALAAQFMILLEQLLTNAASLII